MKTFLAFVCFLCAATACGNLIDEWNQWKEKYGKQYSSSEEEDRFNTWKANYKIVKAHNELFDADKTTYKMGINKFAAMTLQEFRALLIPSGNPGLNVEPTPNVTTYASGIMDVPTSVDWRQQGYVTPVKDQGDLGSCYSFSAIGAVEGQYMKQTGTLLSLSEQQVVDCDQGGDGGIPYRVYKYLLRCGGSQTGAEYPYVNRVGKCKYDPSKVAAKLNSYRFVRPFNNEDALKVAVAKVGPISVSPIKMFLSFQLYESGIYYEPKCNDPNLEGQGYHAMLVTGYGTRHGQDYWMVKNSWGKRWGEDGYIRMSRNQNNNCGIASQPTYPIMASKQPEGYGAAPGGDGMAQLPSYAAVLLAVLISFCLFRNR